MSAPDSIAASARRIDELNAALYRFDPPTELRRLAKAIIEEAHDVLALARDTLERADDLEEPDAPRLH